MGEGLSFMQQRIDDSLPQDTINLEHPVSTYLQKNVNYTFSGLNYNQTFLNLLLEMGVDTYHVFNRLSICTDGRYNEIFRSASGEQGR